MINRRRTMGQQLEKVTVTTNLTAVSTNIYVQNINNASQYYATATNVTSLTAYVPYGVSYRVYASQPSGYSETSGKTYYDFTAGQAERSVSFTYERVIVVYFKLVSEGTHHELYAYTYPAVKRLPISASVYIEDAEDKGGYREYLLYNYQINTTMYGATRDDPAFLCQTDSSEYGIWSAWISVNSNSWTTYKKYDSSENDLDGVRISWADGFL